MQLKTTPRNKNVPGCSTFTLVRKVVLIESWWFHALGGHLMYSIVIYWHCNHQRKTWCLVVDFTYWLVNPVSTKLKSQYVGYHEWMFESNIIITIQYICLH